MLGGFDVVDGIISYEGICSNVVPIGCGSAMPRLYSGNIHSYEVCLQVIPGGWVPGLPFDEGLGVEAR